VSGARRVRRRCRALQARPVPSERAGDSAQRRERPLPAGAAQVGERAGERLVTVAEPLLTGEPLDEMAFEGHAGQSPPSGREMRDVANVTPSS
jgi:hypothetical protein